MFDLKKSTALGKAKLLNKEQKESIELGPFQFDTRRLKPGETFVAIVGEGNDGHNYLEEAVKKAPVLLVTEQKWKKIPLPQRNTFLKKAVILGCPDAKKSMHWLASAWRGSFPSLPLFAITGSNGKTTTKDILGHILCKLVGKKKALVSKESFNNDIGLPVTLSHLNHEHECAVLEMGTNHYEELKNLAEIAKPSGAIITNIGDSHLEQFENKAGVLRAKWELVEGLVGKEKIWFVNEDDPLLKQASQTAPIDLEKIFFSSQNPEADYCVKVLDKIHKSPFGYQVQFSGQRMTRPVKATLPLPGTHNAHNALAAFTIAVHYFKKEPKAVAAALQDVTLSPNRSQIIPLNRSFIFNDSYNANPSSMRAALQTAAHLASGPLYIALGEFLEMGSQAEEKHYLMGKEIACAGACALGVCGKYAKSVAKGALEHGIEEKNILLEESPEKLFSFFVKKLQKAGAVLLVKGSRGAKMERLVDILIQNQKQ